MGVAGRRYRVEFAPAAARQLTKLDAQVQRRIISALHALAADPRPRGVVQLSGTRGAPRWRLRVGDYRVIYEVHDARLLVLVVRVGHRRDVYR
jgi:mRNA interferase RelE/StbE